MILITAHVIWTDSNPLLYFWNLNQKAYWKVMFCFWNLVLARLTDLLLWHRNNQVNVVCVRWWVWLTSERSTFIWKSSFLSGFCVICQRSMKASSLCLISPWIPSKAKFPSFQFSEHFIKFSFISPSLFSFSLFLSKSCLLTFS